MKRFVSNSEELLTSAAVCYGEDIGLVRTVEHPPFLLGNGYFGGCVDALGMLDALTARPTSFLWHKYHVEVGRDQLECRLPLLLYRYRFALDGRELPLSADTVEHYHQALDVRGGCVSTAYTLTDDGTPVARVALTQCISLATPELMLSRWTVTPLVTGLSLTVENEMLCECICKCWCRSLQDCPVCGHVVYIPGCL